MWIHGARESVRVFLAGREVVLVWIVGLGTSLDKLNGRITYYFVNFFI